MNVKLKIIRQTYQSTDYNIFTFFPIEPKLPTHPKWRNVSVKGGNLSFLTVGNIYTLDIEPIDDYTYQLVSMPQVDASTLSYTEKLSILSECTSEKLANEMLTKYPDVLSLIINNQTDQIDVKQLSGIKKKLLAKISNNIKAKYSYCIIQQQFKQYYLSFSDAKILSDKYGAMQEIEHRLNENPYTILINDLERSFEKTDTLLKRLRPDLLNSEIRAEYAIISVLNSNELSGNTYMIANDMAKKINDFAPEIVSKLKQVCISSEKIYYNYNENIVAKMSTYLCEKNIAEFIKNKLCVVNVQKLDENDSFSHIKNEKSVINQWNFNYIKYKQIDDIELTDEQIRILKSVCENNICMLLGAGGTGKSSSIKALVNMLEDNNKSYLLLTPTGTSAKVLSKYTNRPASTIHKKLAMDGYIDADVVIIDEFSFVGVDLMNMIVSNINPESKLVLVADEYQLGSISCGNVLKDMIDSNKIPYCRLTKVFRYGLGALDTVATDTRNGVPYIQNNKEIFKNSSHDESYHFIPINSNPVNQVLNIYESLLTKYNKDDILILSPFNVNNCGAIEINNMIQEKYNPIQNEESEVKYTFRKNVIRFRKNDRVLNVKNWYDALSYDDEENAKVMNGEIGTVIGIEDDDVIVQFDDYKIVYTPEYRKYLILAYAETIHKAQGNQAKAVIFISAPIHTEFLHRALIYVANSRAQEVLYQIGDCNSINEALKKIEINERKTMLKEMIIKE